MTRYDPDQRQARREERRGRHAAQARPASADGLGPSAGGCSARLLRHPRHRPRRAVRPSGHGGLARSCRRLSHHHRARPPPRSRVVARRCGFHDSGGRADRGDRRRLPARRAAQRRRAGRGRRPGRHRPGRRRVQIPGSPHLPGRPHLSERAYRDYLRACRDGWGAACVPAAAGSGGGAAGVRPGGSLCAGMRGGDRRHRPEMALFHRYRGRRRCRYRYGLRSRAPAWTCRPSGGRSHG